MKNDFIKMIRRYAKFIFAIITMLFVFALFSCGYAKNYAFNEAFYRSFSTAERAIYTEIDSPQNLGTEYDVLIITDTHFGGENLRGHGTMKDEEFFQAISQLEIKPKFCICLGDVAEHGIKSEFEDYNRRIVSRLENDFGIKTYTIIGNHDLYNTGYAEYKKAIFPTTTFFHFATEKFSFYFIDSASNSLGHKQVKELEAYIENDDKAKLIFSHNPLYAEDAFVMPMQNTSERNELICLFNKNNVKAALVGHLHRDKTSNLGAFTEYTTADFLSRHKYGILTINEQTETATFSRYSFAPSAK